MNQDATPSVDEVTLSRCQEPPSVAVVTTVAPVGEDQSLYVSTGTCLYALNARDGTVRWCHQVTLTREQQFREQLARAASEHPLMSFPPLPRATFATPQVAHGVHGVVYVCVEGRGAYTCAFNADDGALRWRTPTDARVASMPFMDYAVPLVHDGKEHIVYSGTYALSAQDGSVLWRAPIDTAVEGTLSLHALVDETIYATTQWGIYAINALNGQIRWHYQPDEQTTVSGPPIVSGRLLYAGTRGSVWYPEKSYLSALDVETSTEVWRYSMGSYIGAVVQHEAIYVSSGDRFLYALDAKNGALRWRHPFAAPGHYPATVAEDVLYIATDGAYALRSADGEVLWHLPLESSPSVSFCQPVVLDGAVYLVRLDKRGGVLYALDARTGAECWHTSYPSALALAQ